MLLFLLVLTPPEKFIQNVLKNVGRQHLDVDSLTQQDLNRLSSLIADALQVVDEDQGPNAGLTQLRPGPRDLDGEDELEDTEETGSDVNEEKLLEDVPTVRPQSILLVPAALEGTTEAFGGTTVGSIVGNWTSSLFVTTQPRSC